MPRRVRQSSPPPSRWCTARLQLRQVRPDDAEAVYVYAADERVCRYLAWKRHRTLADSRQFLQQAVEGWQRGDWLNWCIEDDSGVVGMIGVQPGRAGAGVGYVLAHRAWGRGYASEVLAGLSERLLGECSLPALWAYCLPQNAASARVLERCGFTLERVVKNYFSCPNLGDEWHDVRLYVRRT